MDTFPLIVPQEYSSSFQTNLTRYEDERSGFESVKKKGFINHVRENLEPINFQLSESQVNSCLAVLEKNKPFVLKISLTETMVVRCMKYSVRYENGFNNSSPGIYQISPGVITSDRHTLTITVKQFFKP